MKVARSQNRTWHEIGAALGRSRAGLVATVGLPGRRTESCTLAGSAPTPRGLVGNVSGSAPQNRDVASVTPAIPEAVHVRWRTSWQARNGPTVRVGHHHESSPCGLLRRPKNRDSGCLASSSHASGSSTLNRTDAAPAAVPAGKIPSRRDHDRFDATRSSRWSADNDDDVILETDRQSKSVRHRTPSPRSDFRQTESGCRSRRRARPDASDAEERACRCGPIEAGLTGTAVAGSSSLGRPTHKGALAMIFGAHVVVYSNDASADRSFFRDVLGYASVDAGHDWLIFALPPAELPSIPRTRMAGTSCTSCATTSVVRWTPWLRRASDARRCRRGPMGDGDQDPTSRWGDGRPVRAQAPDGTRAGNLMTRQGTRRDPGEIVVDQLRGPGVRQASRTASISGRPDRAGQDAGGRDVRSWS